VKGWFSDTLQKSNYEGEIAILRMDADWYDSTLDILNNLFPLVDIGGRILIDDYYSCPGCSKAVHDYLSIYKREERLCTHRGGVCYLVKKYI
jgi:O-methyltransferase